MGWRRPALAAVAQAVLATQALVHAQISLPVGAVTLINEDRSGSQIALCAETAELQVQKGVRKIAPTGVWAGKGSKLHRLRAGLGACDPAWSPNGRHLAVTAAEGLWVFPAESTDGILRVEAKTPFGEPTDLTYRAFSHPRWSPDGMLVALLVTNGATSWVEVFDAASGKLFYTSPPANYSFSWGDNARELRLGDLEIRLPARPRH
jgi:hypothetical protein